MGQLSCTASKEAGGEVRRLVRRAARSPGEVSWDPTRGTIDADALEGVDAVINLAGENLAQRWTDDIKRRIRDSRVQSTTLSPRRSRRSPRKPRVFLSGSAIGVYGDRGDEVLDESSSLGDDFLASVCKEWEAAAEPAADAGIRVVNLRTGIVLSREGGALPKMLLPFRFGVGGKIGSGRQWMSWIALADYVDAVAFLLIDRIDARAGEPRGDQPRDERGVRAHARARARQAGVVRRAELRHEVDDGRDGGRHRAGEPARRAAAPARRRASSSLSDTRVGAPIRDRKACAGRRR